ncbi:unnamed protein product, partial [Phaeothamnion confervicola]
MAWGAKKKGVDDLVERLRYNGSKTATICLLSSRTFGDAEAVKLSAALADNTSLTELLASGHSIGARGAAAIGAALARNGTLRCLALGSATFGDDGVRALVVGGLSCNAGLTTLDLEHKSLTQADDLGRLLVVHPTLQELRLGRNQLGDEAVRLLAEGLMSATSRLTTLSLSGNIFGAPGAASLAAALRAVSGAPLAWLDVSENPLEDEGTAAILLACGANRSSGGSDEVDGKDASAAANASFLPRSGAAVATLALRSCGAGAASAAALAELLSSGSACALTSIDLSCNALGAEGAAAIAAALPANRTLRSLALAANGIGDAGAEALGMALSRGLRRLDLAANGIGGAGAAALLPPYGRLEELRLFDNFVADVGAGRLAAALAGNGAVRGLDLGANRMSGCGVETVVAATSGHPSLRTLELGGNAVDAAVEAAIEAARGA